MEFVNVDDIKQYLKDNIIKGTLKPFFAVKVTAVTARRGNIGEIINTFSSEGLHETTKAVLRNNKGEIDWVVTNLSGNTYVMENDSFLNDYKQSKVQGEYEPLQREKLIIKLHENIVFKNKFGNTFKPKKDHFIVVDDNDDFYELSPQNYEKDYKVLDKVYNYETDDSILF